VLEGRLLDGERAGEVDVARCFALEAFESTSTQEGVPSPAILEGLETCSFCDNGFFFFFKWKG